MTHSDKNIVAAAVVPVCIFLVLMLAFLMFQPIDVPAGVIPGAGVVVVIASIALAKFLRLRRDRR